MDTGRDGRLSTCVSHVSARRTLTLGRVSEILHGIYTCYLYILYPFLPTCPTISIYDYTHGTCTVSANFTAPIS